jgi:hypothetical protein
MNANDKIAPKNGGKIRYEIRFFVFFQVVVVNILLKVHLAGFLINKNITLILDIMNSKKIIPAPIRQNVPKYQGIENRTDRK